MRGHLIVSERDQALANWREAFPDAEIRSHASMKEAPGLENAYSLVWIHVKHDEDAVSRLNAAAAIAPRAPRVILANVPDQEAGLAVLEAGASGYVSALAVPDLLRQLATVVENGGLWVGPELMQRLLTALAARRKTAQGPDALARLSPREQEVARAVAAGASNKEIARQLGITERTVKAHLSAIFEALRVRDRLQLSLLVNGVAR